MTACDHPLDGHITHGPWCEPGPEPCPPVTSNGVSLIAAERRRQVEAEGWTPEHDDHHAAGEMARAAACYTLTASAPIWATRLAGSDDMRGTWPLRWEFKQADPVRMLTKAGALIAAEIDRLQRKEGT